MASKYVSLLASAEVHALPRVARPLRADSGNMALHILSARVLVQGQSGTIAAHDCHDAFARLTAQKSFIRSGPLPSPVAVRPQVPTRAGSTSTKSRRLKETGPMRTRRWQPPRWPWSSSCRRPLSESMLRACSCWPTSAASRRLVARDPRCRVHPTCSHFSSGRTYDFYISPLILRLCGSNCCRHFALSLNIVIPSLVLRL